jgi:hypothetical protein
LSNSVRKIKEELAPVYGLKNLLSAGIVLFSNLSDSEQKKLIGKINKMEQHNKNSTPAKKEADIKNALQVIGKAVSGSGPAVTHKILSKEESNLLDQLRKELGPGRELSPAQQAEADEAAAYSDYIKKKRSRGRRESSKAS